MCSIIEAGKLERQAPIAQTDAECLVHLEKERDREISCIIAFKSNTPDAEAFLNTRMKHLVLCQGLLSCQMTEF